MNNFTKIDNKIYAGIGVEKTFDELEAGHYEVNSNNIGLFFLKKKMQLDKTNLLKSKPVQEIVSDMKTFLEPETREKYSKYGLTYKRSYLMHGPQGTGKTTTVTKIMDYAIQNNDALVFMEPELGYIPHIANIINQTSPGRLMIFSFEEIDKMSRGGISHLLSILDGTEQMNNCIFLATTNHLKQLPDSVTKRPSRFALVSEISYPDEETRRHVIIENALRYEVSVDVDDWVQRTKDFTIDHIKELFICCFIFDMDHDEVFKRLGGCKVLNEEQERHPEIVRM